MISDKKKVAILSNFFDYDPAYSLIRVTEDQIKMLVDHDYEPVVIVSESFEPEGYFSHEKVNLKKISNVACHNSVKKDETFEQDVLTLEKEIEENLKDIDVVITQDIVYKPSELKYNFASRKVAQNNPNIKWLHWIHSATPPVQLNTLMGIFQDEYLELMKKPFPNSYYVFFNKISEDAIARNFNVPKSMVRTVHHGSDLDLVYGVTTNTLKNFIRKRDIYDADAICVYPARLDRGKQPHYMIRTMAAVKELGLDVRAIVIDFHSTGGDKVVYRDKMKAESIDLGLTPKELSFTSEFSEEWELGMSHEEIIALFRMSNIFIMPSVSESYSLVTQEAGLTGVIPVLNQDFPPFRDIFGPNAIYRKYSSNWDVMAGYEEALGEGRATNTAYGPNNVSEQERVIYEKRYHKDTAGMIVDRLRNQETPAFQTRLRKLRGLDYIFKNELEPLFYS